ncbi:GAF domain-containing protein [Phormidesmis priestleyi]
MTEEDISTFNFDRLPSDDRSLTRIMTRLSGVLERDALVRQTVQQLRSSLETDRVVLYYFYRQWKGRVTFESLSSERYSILGQTGPDECFNGDYAAMYEAGRVRAIANIDIEPIADCHREFLRGMNVRANLVVPVLMAKGLWGLLVAHHCRSPRAWSHSDIQQMQKGAEKLATAKAIVEIG